nr:unnamed protein product [Digitaria exilis]
MDLLSTSSLLAGGYDGGPVQEEKGVAGSPLSSSGGGRARRHKPGGAARGQMSTRGGMSHGGEEVDAATGTAWPFLPGGAAAVFPETR